MDKAPTANSMTSGGGMQPFCPTQGHTSLLALGLALPWSSTSEQSQNGKGVCVIPMGMVQCKSQPPLQEIFGTSIQTPSQNTHQTQIIPYKYLDLVWQLVHPPHFGIQASPLRHPCDGTAKVWNNGQTDPMLRPCSCMTPNQLPIHRLDPIPATITDPNGSGLQSQLSNSVLSSIAITLHPHDPVPLPYLPRPSKSNGKNPKFDGNNTSCCFDKGVVCALREKKQEGTIVS